MSPTRATLYLCEKPSQARDIARILGASGRREGYLEGGGVRVSWCLGHLLEMWMPEDYQAAWRSWRLESLPIVPEHWQRRAKSDTSRQLAVIQWLLRESVAVVIATDADREGETIAREILEECGYRGEISRLWLSALDDVSIRKALAVMRPGQWSEPLYRAGVGRARADWLVGINLSRAFTLLGRNVGHDGVLTVGRVQTPTLKLVVDRDREIENFRSVPYFDVRVTARVEQGELRARWVPPAAVADGEGRCTDKSAAEAVVGRVGGATGTVDKAETKRMREPPPLPPDLATLQQEASRRWGWGAKKTLDLAQSLYETHKAITYPRTDCRYLPVSQFSDAPRILRSLADAGPEWGEAVHGADAALRSRVWDDGKITAHHGIIPTGALSGSAKLTGEESRLFDVIARHYISQFYPPWCYDRTVIELLITGEKFRATGRVEVDPGWKRVMRGEEPPPEAREEEPFLPKVRAGESARVVDVGMEEKRTKPPARYTEGTLIQAMKNVGRSVKDPNLAKILKETAGIGTEATRATIIENLLKRVLLAREGRKDLISTPAGRMLVDMLPHSVSDPATTAVWEQALDEIARGTGSLEAFLQKSASWVARVVVRVKERAALPMPPSVVVAPPSGLPLCLSCGRPMRRRRSARGPFLGCSGYPACKRVLPEPALDREPESGLSLATHKGGALPPGALKKPRPAKKKLAPRFDSE
ncbi:MAG: DNA topoisomerase III [Magnetococcales bacterium]|nr:DNA topoisomerase III [Magnetococcales bacterium]